MLKVTIRMSAYGLGGGLAGFILFMYAWPMRLVIQFVRPDWKASYSLGWFVPPLISLVAFSSMVYSIAHLGSNPRYGFLNGPLLLLGIINSVAQAFFYLSIEPNWLSPGAFIVVPVATVIYSFVALCLIIEIYKGYDTAKSLREK